MYNCTKCNAEVEKLYDNLCWRCKDDELQSALRDVNSALNREAVNLHQITSPGDFHNLQLQSNIELKRSIYADTSIPESERTQKYFEALLTRIKTLDSEIRLADDIKFAATQKRSAITNELRQYGNEVRQEIRDEIKKNDANYQPVNLAPVKVNVKKATKNDPFERMAQMIALANGISIEAARLRLKAGGIKNEAKS